ncbi:hypothetical protein CYMTET_7687 [Cymbomonas tetramitiformis]|uniref:Uncharacterized protein n=1 Tax=Cymbomonas tetramitiformis TaxID=36881 RepID=A0AAE0LH89_9CHLO|nr:hypothetical protein CYMTET_7687 [Cymbomonas tetramitiformis]
MATNFWNQDSVSVKAPNITGRTLPGCPEPLKLFKPSGLDRSVQLHILQRFLHVPCTPSFSQSSGGVVVDRVMAHFGHKEWWMSSTLRTRAQSIWSQRHDEEAKPLLDPEMYGFETHGRTSLGRDTVLTAKAEFDSLTPLVALVKPNHPAVVESTGTLGETLRRHARARATLRGKIPLHEVTAEAAINERCVDAAGGYWDLPESLSLDCTSKFDRSPLSYRVGLQKRRKVRTNASCDEEPERCIAAQAAVQVQHKACFWRRAAQAATPKGTATRRPPYGAVLETPRLALDMGVGALLSCPISSGVQDRLVGIKGVSVGQFGHLGATLQLGSFSRLLCDYTKVCVRLATGAPPADLSAPLGNSDELRRTSAHGEAMRRDATIGPRLANHTLTATLSQQIVGPVRGRMEARFSMDPMESNPSASLQQVKVMETVYGVDVCLPVRGAMRLVAWYSPTRQEAMAEFRLLES